MKITLVRQACGKREEVEFDYRPRYKGERPMALDVLIQAQETELPGLAYRYGCRNGLCGVCTLDVNGKSRLACRTKLRQGDCLSSLGTLPVVKDFVVRRDGVNRQLKDRLPVPAVLPEKQMENSDAYLSLNRCIECYACLDGCPLHAENSLDGDEVYSRGNPYSLLKLQKLQVDANASDREKAQALALAGELGLERCESCDGCTCGVGIDLKREVIGPLVDARRGDPGSEKE